MRLLTQRILVCLCVISLAIAVDPGPVIPQTFDYQSNDVQTMCPQNDNFNTTPTQEPWNAQNTGYNSNPINVGTVPEAEVNMHDYSNQPQLQVQNVINDFEKHQIIGQQKETVDATGEVDSSNFTSFQMATQAEDNVHNFSNQQQFEVQYVNNEMIGQQNEGVYTTKEVNSSTFTNFQMPAPAEDNVPTFFNQQQPYVQNDLAQHQIVGQQTFGQQQEADAIKEVDLNESIDLGFLETGLSLSALENDSFNFAEFALQELPASPALDNLNNFGDIEN